MPTFEQKAFKWNPKLTDAENARNLANYVNGFAKNTQEHFNNIDDENLGDSLLAQIRGGND